MPQKTTLEANGLAEADVRDTTVTLPEGVELSPAAANGLEACSEAQIGFTGLQPDDADERIRHEQAVVSGCVEGGARAYQDAAADRMNWKARCTWRSPAPNGGSRQEPVRVARGVVYRRGRPGVGCAREARGEGRTERRLRCGSRRRSRTRRRCPLKTSSWNCSVVRRASVSTPALCGDYGDRSGVHAVVGHWHGEPVLSPAEEFEITSGANGGGCPGEPAWGSRRGLTRRARHVRRARSRASQLELSRPDGDQALSSVSMHLPPGVAALLSSVKLCEEPQAASG